MDHASIAPSAAAHVLRSFHRWRIGYLQYIQQAMLWSGTHPLPAMTYMPMAAAGSNAATGSKETANSFKLLTLGVRVPTSSTWRSTHNLSDRTLRFSQAPQRAACTTHGVCTVIVPKSCLHSAGSR